MKKAREEVFDELIEDDIDQGDYEYKHLVNCQAKGKNFTRVNFRYSVLEDSYFHQAKFVDCDFTGVIFRRNNFRSASFTRCNFSYSTFESTILPYDQILLNLPKYENIRLNLLKNLRVNAEQIGERDILERLIIAEANTLTEHYKKAFTHNESYYKEKYKGFLRIKNFFKYIGMKSKKILWNHGYSYIRILIVSLIFLFLMSILPTIRSIGDSTLLSDITELLLNSIWNSICVYVDVPLEINILNDVEILILVISRYITIGIFINVFYIKNIKK